MEIIYFASLPSTNTYLKEHPTLSDQTVISADRQTKGKGRLGRDWSTPTGNLSASILLHNPQGDLSLYPLLCALAGCQLLERYTDQAVAIKWPNDLVINRQKVCGILCESVIGSTVQVICGMGMNLNMTAKDLADQQLPHGTSLLMITGQTHDNRALAKELMEIFVTLLQQFAQEGFLPLKSLYESKLISKDEQVQVVYQGKTVQARCLGIADNGNLICQNDTGSFTICSGEASVRGLYGYI